MSDAVGIGVLKVPVIFNNNSNNTKKTTILDSRTNDTIVNCSCIIIFCEKYKIKIMYEFFFLFNLFTSDF